MKSSLSLPLLSVALLTVLSGSLSAQQEPWRPGFESITAQELFHHLCVLADDSMRGRNTPSPELDKAAEYIATQFQMDGLQPVGDSAYFQHFLVSRTRLGQPNTLRFIWPDRTWECCLKQDFVPLPQSASGQVEAEVVFVGYGITAPEFGYDDYAGIDVHDKIVMMFTHEPRERDSTDVFDGPRPTDHSKILVKMMNAIDHGAIGMILVNDPLHHIARRPPNRWPSLMRRRVKGGVPLRLTEPGEEIVAVHIGRLVADSLFKLAGRDLVAAQRSIDSTLRPLSFPLHVRANIQVTLQEQTARVKNVVGYLPGSDPALRGQVVVLGAHYDHVGTRDDTIVYNGSDDNASGTSGLLEIIQAFALNKLRPRRSLLFIAFAGEEKGLFGSRYYVSHPLFPIDSTVAMINLDMISRNDTNQVGVAGSTVSPELYSLVLEANRHVGMEITKEADRFFRQSDHYSFYREDIPVLFFNTLEHADLHKPTDDVDKAIPPKMERVARLVFLTAWKVANMPGKPTFHPFEAPTELARKPATGESGHTGPKK